jgi:hypothetical protein
MLSTPHDLQWTSGFLPANAALITICCRRIAMYRMCSGSTPIMRTPEQRSFLMARLFQKACIESYLILAVLAGVIDQGDCYASVDR